MKIRGEKELPSRTLVIAFVVAWATVGPRPVFAVEYKLEFEGLWNGSHVQGGVLPGGAHFTTLIGATHSSGQPLWQGGGLATQGIENVAEIGNIAALSQEIQARIAGGTADAQILMFPPGLPGTTETTFEIDVDHPNVSLISMIAPSPDWFVGVSDVPLRDGFLWVESLTVDLHPYDAGTEDGTGFSLSNPATDPPEPIALVGSSPFIGNPVIARLHFTLLSPQPEPIPLLPAWVLPLWMGLFAVAGYRALENRRRNGVPREP